MNKVYLQRLFCWVNDIMVWNGIKKLVSPYCADKAWQFF